MLCAALGHFNCVQLFATLWTVACQAPLSIGFSRQEYWRGLLCPSPGDLFHPGIEVASLAALALAGGFFITSAPWEAPGACTQKHIHTEVFSIIFINKLFFQCTWCISLWNDLTHSAPLIPNHHIEVYVGIWLKWNIKESIQKWRWPAY